MVQRDQGQGYGVLRRGTAKGERHGDDRRDQVEDCGDDGRCIGHGSGVVGSRYVARVCFKCVGQAHRRNARLGSPSHHLYHRKERNS